MHEIKIILLSFKNQLTSVLRHCMFLSFWHLSIFILKIDFKKTRLKVLSFFSLVNSQGLHPFSENHTHEKYRAHLEQESEFWWEYV